MAQLLTALYLLLMLAAGWRLYGISWSLAVKVVTALALILPLPLLLIVPALQHPEHNYSDLLRAIGLTLLVCGLLCLLGGLSAAWARARRK